MQANALARFLAFCASAVKSRKHAAVVSAAAIAVLGSGAVGVHALQADPSATSSAAATQQDPAQPVAGHTPLDQAVSEINPVIGQYQDLASFLVTRHESAVTGGPSPAASPSSTSGSPSPSPDSPVSPADTSPSPSPA